MLRLNHLLSEERDDENLLGMAFLLGRCKGDEIPQSILVDRSLQVLSPFKVRFSFESAYVDYAYIPVVQQNSMERTLEF